MELHYRDAKGIKLGRCLVMLVYVLFVLSGCANTPETSESYMAPAPIDKMVSKDYTFLLLDDLKIKPCGILAMQDRTLISDWNSNSIVLLDKNYDYKGSVGKLGSSPKEFIRPTGLAANSKYILVIDSGNHRIQVLTHEYDYLFSIPLPQEAGVSFHYVTVDEKNKAYLWSDAASVYTCSIGENQNVQKLNTPPFWGALHFSENECYASNTFICIKDGEDEVYRYGENTMYTLKDELRIYAELPYKYSPVDFQIDEDAFYFISSTYQTLDRFNLQGEYVQTIFSFMDTFIEIVPDQTFLAKTDRGDFIVGYTNTSGESGVVIIKRI